MCIRSMPYGYMMANGQKATVSDEAEIINEVYLLYLSEKTLKQIADILTERKVDYFHGNTVWSKNIISRIIAETRYLGNDGFPRIVSDELFESVKAVRDKKSAKQAKVPAVVADVKKKLICTQCGQHFRRINKWRSREKWLCSGGCKCSVYLDDKYLLDSIRSEMGDIVRNGRNYTQQSAYTPTIEITRMTNEINRLMELPKVEFKAVASAIFECATEKFDCCQMANNQEQIGEILQILRDSSESMDEKLLDATVEQIYIDENGKITLLFKSEKYRENLQ